MMILLRLAAVAALLGTGACSRTRQCRAGTVLANLTFDQQTAPANRLELRVVVDGVTTGSGAFEHIPGARMGTIEISFAHGYPDGHPVVIEVTALEVSDGKTIILGMMAGKRDMLPAGCDLIAVTPEMLDGGAPDVGLFDAATEQETVTDGAAEAPEDAACSPGTHLCNGRCADNTSIETCGTACEPCALPGNAERTTCDGKTCGAACRPGFHLCGTACVSNMAVETCAGSCAACVAPKGGTATCDGVACGGNCPTGQKLCAGGCIAADQSCMNQCPSGSHDCSGLCLADASPSSCGASCAPCASPANGTATCSAGMCDIMCNTGYKKCGDGSCVPKDGCCVSADCPSVANGIATCGSNHGCMASCNSGFHLCGAACLSNVSPTSCGTSCTPCTAPVGGSATCDGSVCGASCPSGMRLCAGQCLDSAVACGNTCLSGTHNCNGQCLVNASVNSCGTSCSPCVAPANASASCANGTCGWSCNAGYRACNGACIPVTSCCAAGDCPGAANGTATCTTGHTCGIRCDAGHHLCGNACADDMSTLSCGASCTPCPVPTGGSATCVTGTCGAVCPGGYKLCASDCIPVNQACMGVCSTGTHNCNGQCLSNGAPSSCGTSCAPCPGTANGTATCANGTCGLACSPGYRLCRGACISSNTCCNDTDCPNGACSNGICCPTGQTNCNGSCVDLQFSGANCGACGVSCGLTCNKARCEDCQGNGTWVACRGTGCWVCAEMLGGYTRYFQNHPSCVRNEQCAAPNESPQFYLCSSKCPAPTDADR